MGDEGWIGVDLDGTLAFYDGWKGVEHIGVPIARMVERVKLWHDQGKEIKIFTARVAGQGAEVTEAKLAIWAWCAKHLGFVPEITCIKDMRMVELWDDRAVRVELNTGEVI